MLSDHEPQMIAEASSLVAFFVAARAIVRQSEDLITYYHPRVESGIERAFVRRSKLEAKRMFRLLVDVLTSSDGPGEEWGAGAAARLIAAIKDSDKFDMYPKPVAAAKVDSWLATRLTEMGAGFDANLKLAAAAQLVSKGGCAKRKWPATCSMTLNRISDSIIQGPSLKKTMLGTSL